MQQIKNSVGTLFKYLSLIVWASIVLLPVITVFFGAFKTYDEFISTSGLTPPRDLYYFKNFITAFNEGHMLRGFLNTFIIMLGGIAGSIVIGSMVAYVMSRFEFKYKKVLLIGYLIVSVMPLELSQVSTFKLIHGLGLYNTLWAPILLYIGADVVMVYIYLQMYEKIPIRYDQAARLEGASYFQVYRKVIFPLLRPATATVCMIKVIAIYNDFYIPYLYLPNEKLHTLSTTLYKFIGPKQIQWPTICAAILISMIPMLIFFLALQKYIYSSFISGSIKK